MKLTSALALSALLGLVAAAPLNAKRDLVWKTVTDEVIETVVVMETVWLKPGEQAPKPTPASAPAAPKNDKPAPNPPAPTPPPKTPSQALEKPNYPPRPPPVPAPAPPAPAPAPKPAPPAPAPAPVAAPVPAPVPAPAPIPAPAPAPKPSSGGSKGSFKGDMTTYDPSVGVGACGYKDEASKSIYQDSEDVVALSVGMMGAQSNGNPFCWKMMKITNPATGQTATGKVVDKCAGCPGPNDIDLSSTLFKKLGLVDVGRYKNVQWEWM